MAETRIVHAPFTPEQVKNLNDFQHSGVMHPFTCSGGGGPHSDRPGRPAVLIASENGWRCPVDGCEHQQDLGARPMQHDRNEDSCTNITRAENRP